MAENSDFWVVCPYMNRLRGANGGLQRAYGGLAAG